jgi:histidinol-phosphate phosphatase family protein
LAHRADLYTEDEILKFVTEANPAGDGLLVAVDAPLRVPNETGARACDREVASVYGRFQAAPYPANRLALRRYGGLRGEAISHRLEALGFRHDPWMHAQQPMRRVVEVFPHPATVTLFALSRTLKYKARAGRGYAVRREELARLVDLLARLQEAEPPLDLSAGFQLPALQGLRGQAFKAVEDTLDAILCAYAALHAWWHGHRGYAIYGLRPDEDSAITGHILVPMPPEAWQRIKRPRILFLDRDDTLNASPGGAPPTHLAEVQLLPHVRRTLHRYASLGWWLVIVTNQGGVAFGYFSEAEAWAVHQAVLDALPVPVDRSYLCPHHPEGILANYRASCPCRKPAPGAVLDALAHFQAGAGECLFVGDQDTDRLAAEAAKVPFVRADEFFGW